MREINVIECEWHWFVYYCIVEEVYIWMMSNGDDINNSNTIIEILKVTINNFFKGKKS